MIHKKFHLSVGAFLLAVLAGMPAFGQPYALPDLHGAVRPGIEVLESRGFPGLAGKRVGLVTNPSGVDRQLRSTIDILYAAPEVNLVALYGPEHGVRGDVYAGGAVSDGRDPRTGLPVHSLYGKTRKPSPEMLRDVDIMVYDIQDVGTRSYTFISTLGLVMRACAEEGIEVMVLDRPNPLGGNKVEGCCVEPGFHSFVGEFSIPYVYGLTVGELAVLINEEGLNRGETGDEKPLSCRLTVIPMEGWTRDGVGRRLPFRGHCGGIPGLPEHRRRLHAPVRDVRRRLDRRGRAQGTAGQLPDSGHRLPDHPLQAHLRFRLRRAAPRGPVFLYGL